MRQHAAEAGDQDRSERRHPLQHGVPKLKAPSWGIPLGVDGGDLDPPGLAAHDHRGAHAPGRHVVEADVDRLQPVWRGPFEALGEHERPVGRGQAPQVPVCSRLEARPQQTIGRHRDVTRRLDLDQVLGNEVVAGHAPVAEQVHRAVGIHEREAFALQPLKLFDDPPDVAQPSVITGAKVGGVGEGEREEAPPRRCVFVVEVETDRVPSAPAAQEQDGHAFAVAGLLRRQRPEPTDVIADGVHSGRAKTDDGAERSGRKCCQRGGNLNDVQISTRRELADAGAEQVLVRGRQTNFTGGPKRR